MKRHLNLFFAAFAIGFILAIVAGCSSTSTSVPVMAPVVVPKPNPSPAYWNLLSSSVGTIIAKPGCAC